VPAIQRAQPALAWKKLSCTKVQERFVEAAARALPNASSVDEALKAAAAQTLDSQPRDGKKARPLPPALRRQVQELRREARGHPRGSPEYQRISRLIGDLMRKHRKSEWKKTLTRIASSKAVEPDTWSLVKHLRKSA
jgi:hypothetical protein